MTNLESSSGNPIENPAVEPMQTDAECRQQRIRDMINLDVFLNGAPNRDPWSIGGVQPRWPDTSRLLRRKPVEGEVLNTIHVNHETGEIKSVDRQGIEHIIYPGRTPTDDAQS